MVDAFGFDDDDDDRAYCDQRHYFASSSCDVTECTKVCVCVYFIEYMMIAVKVFYEYF